MQIFAKIETWKRATATASHVELSDTCSRFTASFYEDCYFQLQTLRSWAFYYNIGSINRIIFRDVQQFKLPTKPGAELRPIERPSRLSINRLWQDVAVLLSFSRNNATRSHHFHPRKPLLRRVSNNRRRRPFNCGPTRSVTQLWQAAIVGGLRREILCNALIDTV